MEPDRISREEEIDLGELFRCLFRRRRLVFGITLVSAIVAAVVSMFLPIYYTAETRIYPPQDKGSGLASQLMGQAGGLLALAGGLGGGKSQLYVAMTKSRTVLDRMVDRFDLMKLYKVKFREDARKYLVGSLTVQEDKKSGIITLTVEERDPKRAASMANAFVEELKSLVGGLAISEAGQRRMFYEEQLGKAKIALARSEEEIKHFQQRTGMIQIDAQASAIIEGIAKLRANIAMKEVQAKVLRSFATAQNPDLQWVEEELRGLRAELAKLETKKGDGFDPLMASSRVPEAGVEYLRRLRDYKYNETLFVALAKQLELARVDEARDATVIQVIDQAIPPEQRSSPKRTRIVLVTAATMFFLSVFIVLVLEYFWKKPGKPPAGDFAATESRSG